MDNRPKFLDLTKIVLPYPGIVSILHRVSGVCILFSWPFILPLIGHSISPEHYHNYLTMIFTLPGRIILWLISAAYIYHACAGCRHFYVDFVVGQNLYWSRFSAKLTLIVAGLLILFSFIRIVI